MNHREICWPARSSCLPHTLTMCTPCVNEPERCFLQNPRCADQSCVVHPSNFTFMLLPARIRLRVEISNQTSCFFLRSSIPKLLAKEWRVQFLRTCSAIWIALSAAPFLIWSPHTNRSRPFASSRDMSLRTRPTKTLSWKVASRGVGNLRRDTGRGEGAESVNA